MSEEIEKLDVSHLRANSRMKSGGGSDSTPDSYADDIETEANLYFHQMFSGQLSIDAMIQMLTRFKESSEKRYIFLSLKFISLCVSCWTQLFKTNLGHRDSIMCDSLLTNMLMPLNQALISWIIFFFLSFLSSVCE